MQGRGVRDEKQTFVIIYGYVSPSFSNVTNESSYMLHKNFKKALTQFSHNLQEYIYF